MTFVDWRPGRVDGDYWSRAGDYGFRISWKYAIPRNTQSQKLRNPGIRKFP